MRIVRNLDELKQPLRNAVVTIGNFDGVHLGHREIFRRVVARSRQFGGPSVVHTFVPHPLKVLAPERAPLLINSYDEKEKLIEASCIDVLICTPFTAALAELPARHFVRQVLVDRIGLRHLVIGYDYLFGKGREGNAALLRQMGEHLGFSVEVLQPISGAGELYSSTRVRQLIQEGQVGRVVSLLGRNFTLQGQVVHGFKRGKTLGFPTANIKTDRELLPATGVYAVRVRRGSKLIDGVLNIGFNPTFEAADLCIEVHLLDFDDSLYGEQLQIYFIERLRDEQRFTGPEHLVRSIRQDIRQARSILATARLIEYHDYLDCGVKMLTTGSERQEKS